MSPIRISTKRIILRQALLSIWLLSCNTIWLTGQQETMISQYNDLIGYYNPSALPQTFMLQDRHLSATTAVRQQWSSLPGGPSSHIVALDYKSSTGNTFDTTLGGYVVSDREGATSSTDISLRLGTYMSDYNSRYGGFSAGVRLGISQFRVDTESLHDRYPDDILTSRSASNIRPSVGIGLGYHNLITEGRYKGVLITGGLSVSQVGVGKTQFTDFEQSFFLVGKPHGLAYLSVRRTAETGAAWGVNIYTRSVPGAPLHADISFMYQPLALLSLRAGTTTGGMGNFGGTLSLTDLLSYDKQSLWVTYSYRHSLFSIPTIFGSTYEISLHGSL